MRRHLAATASLVLHAAVIAGAALIVFPLRLEKLRRDGLEVELLEMPGPNAPILTKRAEPAAAPETREAALPAATPPQVAAAIQPQAATSLPPTIASAEPVMPVPAATAPTIPTPPTFTAPDYVPPRATAIAAVNPPLLGPRAARVPHTALLPHDLPLDPVVPPLNPAPAVDQSPAQSPSVAPPPAAPGPMRVAPSAATPAPAVTAKAAASAPPATRPTPRIDRAALGAQVRQGSAGTPSRGFDRSALGAAVLGARPSGAGRLSMRQKVDLASLIRRQITPCWNPPSMTENPGIVTVTLRIRLEPNGEVTGTPSVSSVSGATPSNQAYVTAMVGSVRRAVLRCAPLSLPADLYDAWSDVELNFDPRDVL